MATVSYTAKNIVMLEGAVGRDFEAGGTVDVGAAVYVNSSGQIIEARANAAATSMAIGILVASFDGDTSIASGERGTVCVFGPVSGYTSVIEGSRHFVSSSAAGEIVDTAPSGAGTWSHAIGYGEKDGVLFVLPGLQAPTSNS